MGSRHVKVCTPLQPVQQHMPSIPYPVPLPQPVPVPVHSAPACPPQLPAQSFLPYSPFQSCPAPSVPGPQCPIQSVPQYTAPQLNSCPLSLAQQQAQPALPQCPTSLPQVPSQSAFNSNAQFSPELLAALIGQQQQPAQQYGNQVQQFSQLQLPASYSQQNFSGLDAGAFQQSCNFRDFAKVREYVIPLNQQTQFSLAPQAQCNEAKPQTVFVYKKKSKKNKSKCPEQQRQQTSSNPCPQQQKQQAQCPPVVQSNPCSQQQSYPPLLYNQVVTTAQQSSGRGY